MTRGTKGARMNLPRGFGGKFAVYGWQSEEWWSDLYQPFIATGVDGVWNDMNEPAVFADALGGTMPEDNLHRGGGDLPPGTHKLYHNVYGMLMTRATRAGDRQSPPGQAALRPEPLQLFGRATLRGHLDRRQPGGDELPADIDPDVAEPRVVGPASQRARHRRGTKAARLRISSGNGSPSEPSIRFAAHTLPSPVRRRSPGHLVPRSKRSRAPPWNAATACCHTSTPWPTGLHKRAPR